MPIFEVQQNGKTYEVDAPDLQTAASSLGGQSQPKQATPPPAAATMGMRAPDTATDRAPSGKLLDLIPRRPEQQRDMRQMVDAMPLGTPAPVSAVASGVRAVPALAAKGVEAGRRIAGLSKFRAGTNIDAAVAAAKDVPLDTTAVKTAVDQMMQYAQPGEFIETVPRVVRGLAKRITSGVPLTVEKARLYYPAISRGSANEFANLTPNMQRLLGGLKAPLNEAITAAAETVGKGEQYAKGIGEYARASKAEKFVTDKAAPAAMAALKRLLQGTALYGGYKTGEKLLD